MFFFPEPLKKDDYSQVPPTPQQISFISASKKPNLVSRWCPNTQWASELPHVASSLASNLPIRGFKPWRLIQQRKTKMPTNTRKFNMESIMEPEKWMISWFPNSLRFISSRNSPFGTSPPTCHSWVIAASTSGKPVVPGRQVHWILHPTEVKTSWPKKAENCDVRTESSIYSLLYFASLHSIHTHLYIYKITKRFWYS